MARASNSQTIQGIQVDSINEYNVAVALDRMGYDYEYQYIYGMAGIRGSQTIDFLVYTAPKPTPLFVHGEYWHTGRRGKDEQLKMQELVGRMRGQWADPVIIWGQESETVEEAQMNLLDKL